MKKRASSSDNLTKLDGLVPFFKALPYGIQHVLAIFIANVAPVILILGNKNINSDPSFTSRIVQNSLLVSGIATLIQLFPIWKIGSRMPIYVGISFTYLSVSLFIGTKYGYDVIISSMLVGSLLMIFFGIFIKNLMKIIPNLVSLFIVFVLGVSLAFSQITEMKIFSKDFYIWQNLLIVALIVLTYLMSSYLFKKRLKNYAILISALVGYIVSICIGLVDFTNFDNLSVVTYPLFINIFSCRFEFEAILSVCVIYLISTTDVFAAIFALNEKGKSTEQAIQGGVIGVGVSSFLSACLGCTPVTPFMGNISITNSTKVVNRYTLSIGAFILIIASFFPIFGAIAMSIPGIVMYTTMTILFISIAVSGLKALISKKLTIPDILVIAITLVIAILLYLVGTFVSVPNILKMIFTNILSTTFIVSIILYYIIIGIKGGKQNEKK